MPWQDLLASNRVDRHTTSRQELDDLRAAADRNLRDAAVPRLSADNRFGLAYEAVVILAKMAIGCAGYRVKAYGGHQTTFAALPLAMGREASGEAAYFDACRRKRNILSYDRADVATDTEAAELLRRAREFRRAVEAWIAGKHPRLARNAG